MIRGVDRSRSDQHRAWREGFDHTRETAELAIDPMAIMVLQAGTLPTFGEMREYIHQSIDVTVQLRRVNGKRGVMEYYLPMI